MSERRLVNAEELFELRGFECCADVPLPSGEIPVNHAFRLSADEWARYRALCELRRPSVVHHRIELEGCGV